MDFHMIHENKLKVILTAADLEGFGIDYDSMDYQDPHTRKALLRILEQGRAETGFDPRKAKLFIEVYPCEGNGCVLFFTCLRQPHAAAKTAMEPVLFAFDSVDALTEGAVKVYSRYGHRIYRSSLYQMEGTYRLVVYPLDYADRLSVYFLTEFGEKIGEGRLMASYTQEHGREIIRDNAIEKLSEFFAPDQYGCGE